MKKIFFFIIATLILTSCSSTTQGGVVGANRSQLLLISSEAMNQSAAQSYVKTLTDARSQGALNLDPVLTKRVQNVAKKLIAQVGVFRQDALSWQWEVNVISSDTINAWCMPGGKIAFYSGIINKLSLNDAQIAAVMGHEMAHALREHGREQASQDQLKTIGLSVLSAVTGISDGGKQLLDIAAKYTISLPFSRTHETEADHMGTELMARAGYDPYEAVKVWQKMQAIGGSKTPEILSTHPSDESRIADLKEIAKKVEPLYLKTKR